MPRYASVAGRPVSRMRLAPSRRERQLHPNVGARVAVVVGDLPDPAAAVGTLTRLTTELPVQSLPGPSERYPPLPHARRLPDRPEPTPTDLEPATAPWGR